MEEIGGYNDRCIIFLLEHKENKTIDDLSNLIILKNRYPDSDKMYRVKILQDLLNRGFIRSFDTRPDLPNCDEFVGVIAYDFEKIKYITTEEGLKALDFGYYKSEYKALNEERKRKERENLQLDLNIDSLKRSKKAYKWSKLAIIVSVLTFLLEAASLSGLLDKLIKYLSR